MQVGWVEIGELRQIKFAVAILCLWILCSRSCATADGPRDAMCQSKFLQLPYSKQCRNILYDKSKTYPSNGVRGYSRPTCFHSATTRSTVVGLCVMHKLTVDEFVDHSNTPTTWCGKVFYVQNVELLTWSWPRPLGWWFTRPTRIQNLTYLARYD